MTIDTILIMINNACAPLTLVFVFCSDPRRVAPLAIANKAAADRRKSFMLVTMLIMLMIVVGTMFFYDSSSSSSSKQYYVDLNFVLSKDV